MYNTQIRWIETQNSEQEQIPICAFRVTRILIFYAKKRQNCLQNLHFHQFEDYLESLLFQYGNCIFILMSL